MEVGVREAAALLGCSPRAVRARLVRGDLPGRKVGSRWRIRTEELPLTEAQRRRVLERAGDMRAVVESQVQRALSNGRDPKRRSALDLDCLRVGRNLFAELGRPETVELAESDLQPARLCVRDALRPGRGGQAVAPVFAVTTNEQEIRGQTRAPGEVPEAAADGCCAVRPVGPRGQVIASR